MQVEITLKSSTNDGEDTKHFLHTKGKDAIRDRLGKYVAALKEGELWSKVTVSIASFYVPVLVFSFLTMFKNASFSFCILISTTEFSKGMILPKKDNGKEDTTNIKSGLKVKDIMNTAVPPTNNIEAGYKIATTTVKQQQKFQCRSQEFYNVFTTVEVNTLSSVQSLYPNDEI